MFNEERRKDVSLLGNLHPRGNVGLVAARAVTEQYGRKGAGTNWFPKVRFEMQRSAWKLHCLGHYRFLGLAESRNRKKEQEHRQILVFHILIHAQIYKQTSAQRAWILRSSLVDVISPLHSKPPDKGEQKAHTCVIADYIG
jgi:hypothetical protein